MQLVQGDSVVGVDVHALLIIDSVPCSESETRERPRPGTVAPDSLL